MELIVEILILKSNEIRAVTFKYFCQTAFNAYLLHIILTN